MITKDHCIFCQNPADTREHIPAKQFFKEVPEKDLITVPSCFKCNKSYQRDEDFFRQFYTGMLMDRSKYATLLMDNEITRSIKRKPALAHQMFSQMQLVNVFTKSGIYVGKKTMYKVSKSDKIRIDKVINKIIQGLFYHEFKKILPKDWIVKIIWITPKVHKDLGLDKTEKTLRWNIINEDIFAYGMSYVKDTFQSIWILDFFRIPVFYVLVLDKETASKKKN